MAESKNPYMLETHKALGTIAVMQSEKPGDTTIANQQETKIGEITCRICGMQGLQLGSHLKIVHGIPNKEGYRKLYPGAPVVSSRVTIARVETNIGKHGTAYPNQKLANSASRQLWADPDWKKGMLTKLRKGAFEKFGVENVMHSPMFQQGPNKGELLLAKLLPPDCQYVGNGQLFLWINGKAKNPDFVQRPFHKTKAVIELFGEHYHDPEEELTLPALYSSIGVRCLVIWYYDLRHKKELVKTKIQSFFSQDPQRLHEVDAEQALRYSPTVWRDPEKQTEMICSSPQC